MACKKVLTLKSRKCRFSIRDPCIYPESIRGLAWNEHMIENLDRAIRRENRNTKFATKEGANDYEEH